MFVAMRALEAKAVLVYKLSLDAFFLQKEQVEKIVNWFDGTGIFDGTGVKVEDLDLRVVKEAKEFSDYCINKKLGFEHSWAGEEYFRQSPYLIIGDVELGKHIKMEYSNNGNYAGHETELIDPDFSIDQLQVLYVGQENYSNFNGRYEDEEKHLLVIYNPVEGYYLSPEIKYILDNFKIQ